MKHILALCVLSALTCTFAFANDGDCTKDQLIGAIQQKCGSSTKYVEGSHIGHFQGEVTDSYVIKMKDGRTVKNMELTAEGGNCQDNAIRSTRTAPKR